MLKLGKITAKFNLSPGSLSYLTLIVVFVVSILWRIGDLLPGASRPEINQKALVTGLHNLRDNLSDAPLRLVQHLFLALHPDRIVSLRLGSALAALIISFCFYKLAAGWFGKSIGLLGTVLFIALPIFSISARQATPQIMLFSPLILMYLYSRVLKTSHTWLWALLALAAGLLIYTPGMIWWIIGAVIISYRKLSVALSESSRAASLAVPTIFGLSLLPIIVLSIKQLSILKPLLLIPTALPSPLHLGGRLIHMIGALFIKLPSSSPLAVGSLPLLNILLLALIIFGAYAMMSAAKDKALALAASVLVGLIAATVENNFVYLVFGIPALMIFATAGLRYLYIEWQMIFPRNPVPKTFALVLITAVSLSQLYYSWHYTLAAWPHSSDARSAFVIK